MIINRKHQDYLYCVLISILIVISLLGLTSIFIDNGAVPNKKEYISPVPQDGIIQNQNKIKEYTIEGIEYVGSYMNDMTQNVFVALKSVEDRDTTTIALTTEIKDKYKYKLVHKVYLEDFSVHTLHQEPKINGIIIAFMCVALIIHMRIRANNIIYIHKIDGKKGRLSIQKL